MVKIVSFQICPFVQRVTALLEAKKLAYEPAYIRLSDKPGWFLDLSPTGQVPILVTDSGTPLFESEAIAEYLDDISPRLQPNLDPEQRALQRAWSYQASKNYLVQCSAMQSANKATFLERMTKLDAAFNRVETVLGDGPFFSGADIGNVDVVWLPLLHRAAIVEQHSGHDMLKRFPRLKSWQAAILETGLPERSVSDDFQRLFTAFYLGERTWLGRGADANEPTVRNAVTAVSGCCG